MKKSCFSPFLAILSIVAVSILASCGNMFSAPVVTVSKPAAIDTVTMDIIPGTGDLPSEDSIESDLSEPSWSEATRSLSAASSRVIILMYHHLIDGGIPGEYDRTISDFRNDMTYLREQGIVVIDFDDLLAIQAGTLAPPAEKLAILSFDDGYSTVYKYAYPILKEYGYKATFFLITSLIANPSANLGADGKPFFLRWKEVKEIAAYRQPVTGFRLFKMGSHTVDHPFLQNRASSFPTRKEYLQWLNKELNQSKAAIERNIGAAANGEMFLALPYGNGYGNTDIITTAKRFGYKGIRTSEWGSFNPYSTDNFMLKSLPILGDSDIHYMETVYTY